MLTLVFLVNALESTKMVLGMVWLVFQAKCAQNETILIII